MVDFHDATKLNGARKSDTHLKSLTPIFLSFFLVFFLIGWEEAVLLFGILYLKGRKLLAVFLGVYTLNVISLSWGLLCPSTILTSIATGMLGSVIIQHQFVVLCSTWAFQFLLELVVF